MFKIAIILTIIALLLTGCSTNPAQDNNTLYPEHQEKVTLITGGYGYEVGDIVLIDTQKEPELGDVVQYDANINKSYCMTFGPGVHLARIIGLPGDNVTFSECSFEANGLTGSFKCGEGIWPRTRDVMWGSDTYRDIAGMRLVMPANEFLADNQVGGECTGETYPDGGTIRFTRFTVKREAINGVILEKLGHDKEFEERQKQIVY